MRKPTEVEWRCAQAACCGQEIGTGGKCKRDPEVCDAVDYLDHVRVVIRAMRDPTPQMLINAGYRAGTSNSDVNPIWLQNRYADAWRAMIDAASPPEST